MHLTVEAVAVRDTSSVVVAELPNKLTPLLFKLQLLIHDLLVLFVKSIELLLKSAGLLVLLQKFL